MARATLRRRGKGGHHGSANACTTSSTMPTTENKQRTRQMFTSSSCFSAQIADFIRQPGIRKVHRKDSPYQSAEVRLLRQLRMRRRRDRTSVAVRANRCQGSQSRRRQRSRQPPAASFGTYRRGLRDAQRQRVFARRATFHAPNFSRRRVAPDHTARGGARVSAS